MMAAYWVVRVNVLDTKNEAYAPLAAAVVKHMAAAIWHVAVRMRQLKAVTMREMSLSAGLIWPQRRPLITV